MQKLRFINGNGVEVDFTSGNFGIVNWSGFSETELNIQTQQVPFQDGSVFLDALIQDRVINVTLAINDEKNLEKRYELRRQIISLMNPKSGLGKLIYQNDIFQRQIECIPQLPVFPTKNFNNGGTLKVSLSFTCPSPYWEDVEETVVKLKLGQRNIVENKGDIQTNIDAEIITTSVENPVLRNLTSDAKIELIGNYDRNIHIDTNLGRKQIFIENEKIKLLTNNYYWRVFYSEQLHLFVAGGSDGQLVYSSDGINWEVGNRPISTHIDNYIRDITYSDELNLFVAITSDSIFTSSDGINWDISDYIGNSLTCITYSEELHLFVIASRYFQILYSSDGINWNSIEFDDPEQETYQMFSNSITYSEELHLFVIVGDGGRNLRSSDGINWIIGESISSNTNFNSIIYSDKLHLFITITENGKLFTSLDGINWGERATGFNFGMKDIMYSNNLNLFVIVGGDGNIITSSDCINWILIPFQDNDILQGITYSESLNLFVIVGGEEIIVSNDGVEFRYSTESINYIKDIVFSNELNMLVAVSNSISVSNDGINWRIIPISNVYLESITYSDELHLFVAVGGWRSNGKLFTSSDGINWNEENIPTIPLLESVIYSKDLHLFVANSANKLMTSSDGINWEIINISIPETTIHIQSITYSDELHLFIILNWEGRKSNIIKSQDLIQWEVYTVTDDDVMLKSITYSDELHLFVAVGDNSDKIYASIRERRIMTSSDGINWRITDFEGILTLKSVIYSKELHLFVIVGDIIIISSDGINWRNITGNLGSFYSSCVAFNKIYCVGNNNISIDFENDRNIIEDIDENSNMNFNLIPGDNELMISYKTGTAIALLKFRNKYLGV